jgi:Domain of unknown function (DUF4340)
MTTMKKQTAVAVAVFAALGLTYLATREKQISIGVTQFKIPSLKVEDVDKIEVRGARSLTLSRESSGWVVFDPAKPSAQFPAEQSEVQSTLEALAALKSLDFVSDSSEKHAVYEVDDASGVSVSVSGRVAPLRLVFGKVSKSRGTYVRKAGEAAIFSTSSPAAYQLKRGIADWRKKSISTAALSEVDSVIVSPANAAPFTLKRSSGDAWTLETKVPDGYRFDPEAAARLVSQLTTLTAQGFVDEPKDFSTSHQYALHQKDGKTVTVQLSTTKDEATKTVQLRVDGNPQVYTLASWQAEQIDKTVNDLRDLTLMRFEVEKVSRLSIGVGQKKTVLAKTGSDWKLVDPKTDANFDPQQVAVQLNRLKGLRALKWVEDASKANFAKPTTIIELMVDNKVQRLVFANEAGQTGEVYVRGSADNDTYVVASSEKESWGKGVELFRKPPPPDLSHLQGLEQLPPDVREKLMQQLGAQR